MITIVIRGLDINPISDRQIILFDEVVIVSNSPLMSLYTDTKVLFIQVVMMEVI